MNSTFSFKKKMTLIFYKVCRKNKKQNLVKLVRTEPFFKSNLNMLIQDYVRFRLTKKEKTGVLHFGVPFTASGVINLKGLRWSKRTRN